MGDSNPVGGAELRKPRQRFSSGAREGGDEPPEAGAGRVQRGTRNPSSPTREQDDPAAAGFLLFGPLAAERAVPLVSVTIGTRKACQW